MPKFNPLNQIQVDTPDRNMFDLSFDNKLTLDMGRIIPVLTQDTLPGDIFSIRPEMLIRFAPLVFPIMHRIDATIHYFFVPNRILWNPWEKFIGNESFSKPFFQGAGGVDLEVLPSSIWDYMGLPLTNSPGSIDERIDALPFMAYYRIFNEYYADQNNDTTYTDERDRLETLQDKIGIMLLADWDIANWTEMPIANRAWEHDYFTSALPFAQKGDAVNIPLTLEQLTGEADIWAATEFGTNIPATGDIQASGIGTLFVPPSTAVSLRGDVTIDGAGAELAGTINQLRVAYALQRFLEKLARGGTRYNEDMKIIWGVDIGDARIGRPEYIGGIKNNIVISEVLQTSQTSADSVLGDYSGHATGVISGNTITYSCLEHGWIIGLLSVVPKPAYFQGIPKKFSRHLLLDYPQPDFAHIGEQAILNKEIFYNNADTPEVNNATFGYIPRYSECKFNHSEVHGQFRTTMMDFHLAMNFATRPVLNEDFIYINPALQKRIFAVQEETDSLYAHIYMDIQARRKLPFWSTPAGI